MAEPPRNAPARAALKARVLSLEHVAGNLVSKDGRASLFVVFLADGASDRTVTRGIRDVAARTLAPLTLYYGGAPFAGEPAVSAAAEG